MVPTATPIRVTLQGQWSFPQTVTDIQTAVGDRLAATGVVDVQSFSITLPDAFTQIVNGQILRGLFTAAVTVTNRQAVTDPASVVQLVAQAFRDATGYAPSAVQSSIVGAPDPIVVPSSLPSWPGLAGLSVATIAVAVGVVALVVLVVLPEVAKVSR